MDKINPSDILGKANKEKVEAIRLRLGDYLIFFNKLKEQIRRSGQVPANVEQATIGVTELIKRVNKQLKELFLSNKIQPSEKMKIEMEKSLRTIENTKDEFLSSLDKADMESAILAALITEVEQHTPIKAKELSLYTSKADETPFKTNKKRGASALSELLASKKGLGGRSSGMLTSLLASTLGPLATIPGVAYQVGKLGVSGYRGIRAGVNWLSGRVQPSGVSDIGSSLLSRPVESDEKWSLRKAVHPIYHFFDKLAYRTRWTTEVLNTLKGIKGNKGEITDASMAGKILHSKKSTPEERSAAAKYLRKLQIAGKPSMVSEVSAPVAEEMGTKPLENFFNKKADKSKWTSEVLRVLKQLAGMSNTPDSGGKESRLSKIGKYAGLGFLASQFGKLGKVIPKVLAGLVALAPELLLVAAAAGTVYAAVKTWPLLKQHLRNRKELKSISKGGATYEKIDKQLKQYEYDALHSAATQPVQVINNPFPRYDEKAGTMIFNQEAIDILKDISKTLEQKGQTTIMPQFNGPYNSANSVIDGVNSMGADFLNRGK